MSGLELAEAVRNKEVSAVEVLDSVYSRIEQFPRQVGAFAHVTPELAGQQAEETDRRVARGETLPFDGVPVPIKALTPVFRASHRTPVRDYFLATLPRKTAVSSPS